MKGPAQKFVSVDEVTVSTMSVEIKTVSIGRRQMSMSLFRQLPRSALIDVRDEGLRLNGMPWGRVNYHWDHCFHSEVHEEHAHEHVHVLWQKDSVLFQAAVPRVPSFLNVHRDNARAWAKTAENICRIGVLVNTLTTDEEIERDGYSVTVGGWTIQDDYDYSFVRKLQEFRNCSVSMKDFQRGGLKAMLEDLCRKLGVLPPENDDEVAEIYGMHSEDIESKRRVQSERLSLYAKRYEEVLALEQLFIAA